MGSNKPTISVILSAYNAEKYIREAIDSILGQTFIDFELIISDDGSTDNTRKIMDSYLDDRIISDHNYINDGKVKTVNRLVELSQGEYLTIHDADDFSEQNRFAYLISFLESNSDIALVGSSFYEIRGTKRRTIRMPTEYSQIKRQLPYISQFHGPTVIFRKKILKSTGGLFRYFKWGEDIDFTTRVVEKHRAINVDIPLYNYRIHSKSLTKDIKQLTPERLVNKELRVFLAKQRSLKGTDCLMNNQPEILEQEKKRLLVKYQIDPSRVYREHSQKMLHYDLRFIALLSAIKACTISLSYKNIKNLVVIFIKAAMLNRIR